MQTNALPAASPESLGIPSQAILDFLDELQLLRLPLHSVLVLRHGKIAAEGYCPPFDAEKKHRMYSTSKSFTSVAVGMMITEGRLSLDEKVADIFPEYLPEHPHPYVLEATVRHLLTMSTFNESSAYNRDSDDFVRCFFNSSQPKHKPGTVFRYDTAATVTLCAIVEKRSGKPMLEYMRPLFDEIGISRDIDCIQTPEGRSWTGSGILCTPRDLARFGLLCLNYGAWNGKQLVDRAYMEAALSRQIDITLVRGNQGLPHGYGYQFWMLEEGGFSCQGMGSQLALMMPKYDTVVVVTGDTQAVDAGNDAIRMAHTRLLRALSDEALPENPEKQSELQRRLSALELPRPVGKPTPPRAADFSGKTYVFDDNPQGFKRMRADIADDVCTLTYENGTGCHTFKLFMDGYKPFLFPERYYGARIGTADREYRSLSMGAWVDENSLLGIVYAVDDYLGTLKMQLTFTEDSLTVLMDKAAEWFFDGYTGYLAGRVPSGGKAE